MENTRATLLGRIKEGNNPADWQEFFDMYWRVIVRYAQKLGLNEASAHDVLQETMMSLIRALENFSYDPKKKRFRNFLLTIVHRKTLRYIQRERKRGEVSIQAPIGEDEFSLEDRLPADQPLPSDDLDKNWQESIRDEALSRLEQDPSIDPRTWSIFKAYVLDNRAVDDIAAEFDVQANAIYQIKNRTMRRLQQEVKRLLAEMEESHDAI